MTTVKIELKETSQPLVYTNVINTYQKGDLFCIYTNDNLVFKYPINNIWRITEYYNVPLRNE
jgi:hypothetical protein